VREAFRDAVVQVSKAASAPDQPFRQGA
jgi:hypothetical protein